MPNIDITGLVTREVKYGENSRILTVLGKDCGKVSVLASRARTNRSGLLTATQLFSYSDFTLFKGRDGSLLKLNEGEVISAFSNIRNSLEKMAYASYFCDIINQICREGAEENELLSLILNMLYLLDRDDCTAKKAVKIRAVFQFRALAAAGFAPDCEGCAECGSSNAQYFSRSGGVFYCEKCREHGVALSEVSEGIFNAIKFITTADSRHILAFSLSDAAMQYLASIGEEFVRTQLEHDFKTLDYLKNVIALG